MKKYLFLTLLLIPVLTVQAGTTTGKISLVTLSYKAGVAYFKLDSTTQDFATCATSNRYVIDVTTDSGKSTLSGLLSAKFAEKTVTVIGDNTCALNPESEDIWYITIN